ncbi:MAG: hypothetical protein ACPGUE_17115 [Marinomonas sp.]|jgi:hypothetical protein|uniref:hypothetical protein n=1 Tax=unclassified Marinomonas TaxID=196814 RepID=UPI00061E0D32|nr:MULTISPECIES: hypothetical protein [unclassified Marinomonas]KJZ08878.1 hypothetical protein TW85_22845 [Marinomonas sp. S3726]KZM38627.1 hypothetical protein OA92_22810 [Marinomonas sp. SBI22]KZM39171.1 hypothetical protein OA91_22660 [Marinomonas sp. SBI8L]
MLYAKLDENNNILDVATEPSDEYKTLVSPHDENVIEILEKKIQTHDTQSMLETSDSEMMRVLEDLVNLLTEKRIIQFTELPMAAQKKLLSRKWVRGIHTGNEDSLIGESDLPDNNDSLI